MEPVYTAVRALEALGLSTPPSPGGAGHAMVAVLAEAVQERLGSEQSVGDRFRQDRAATVHDFLEAARRWVAAEWYSVLDALAASEVIPAGLRAAYADAAFVQRLTELALERTVVHAAAPPVLPSPVPDPRPAAPAGARTIAVFFDQPLAVTHELYPLWTDAYVHGLADRALSAISVLGAHNSWLDEAGRVRRGIRYDMSRDVFLEAPIEAAAVPDAALLICQSSASHRDLVARLQKHGVPCFNQVDLCELADDKWACYLRWRNAGVPTPPTCLLAADAAAAQARATIESFVADTGGSGWIVQPRGGTEGRGATWIPEDADAPARILGEWRSIAAHDDAVLRPRVGLLGLSTPDGVLALDIRLNVACDGSTYAAESGYLQLAGAPNSVITSVERGGRIRPLDTLGRSPLAAAGTDACSDVLWDEPLATACRAAAEQATRAIGPLALAGVDVKLDLVGGRPAPTVLDLNTRPAGLLHANLLGSGEAGIAAGLWRRLAASWS